MGDFGNGQLARPEELGRASWGPCPAQDHEGRGADTQREGPAGRRTQVRRWGVRDGEGLAGARVGREAGGQSGRGSQGQE